MTTAVPLGAHILVPGLPGRWSVWSLADEAPGARFVVPGDNEARATGTRYAVITITSKQAEAFPVIALIRTHPPIEEGPPAA